MATGILLQVRGDTAENWQQRNTLLKNREIGYDQTNRRLKVGDGAREWNDLPFLPPDVIDDLTTGGSGNALSAEQGKALKGLVDTNSSKLTTLQNDLTTLQTNITTQISGGRVTVRDDFNHAESDTALSARCGKVLNDKKADKSELTTLQTNLTTQINQRATTTQLTNLQTTLTNLINKKADKSELTTLQTNLTTQINKKADTTALTTLQTTLTNLINKKADTTALTTLQTNLTTQINNSKIPVINKIASNNSSTAALSAYQGYVLQTNINKKADKTDIKPPRLVTIGTALCANPTATANTNDSRDPSYGSTFRTVTIPDGVNYVYISGCGGGGGMGTKNSGWSAGWAYKCEVSVKKGDTLILKPGLGGEGMRSSTSKCTRGQDSVVVHNGKEIIRLAGGNGGDKGHVGNQTGNTKIGPGVTACGQWEEAHFSSEGKYSNTLIVDGIYAVGLTSPRTRFSPNGEGGTLINGQHGIPGLSKSGVIPLALAMGI